ncbi:MAG: MBL fold metallo-hydrolase, partial [Oscillospiraceae bacterium]|nr:MBL fold metallo-hydrolase [Oscillospiraceae bacterium]
MANFCALYSGSSGNSMVVSSGGASLLVDAGVSCRSIVSALSQADVLPKELSGILVTHEHVDHIKGLAVLTKRFKIPVYSSVEVLEYLQDNNCVAPDCPMYELSSPMEVGGMLVTPFDTPHDSVHSLGFRVDTSDGKSIGIATDLGAVTDQVKAGLTGCDIAMLESNYDCAMLACSAYPYYLKRRIQS